MKLKSNDPLNQLLREALFQQRNKVKVIVEKPLASNVPLPELKQCERPEAWRVTRSISLVHRSPQGRETFLGVFIEMKSDRFSARRLVPAHGQVHGSIKDREIVRDDWWLHQQVKPVHQDSPEELKAIRERFNELMGQLA